MFANEVKEVRFDCWNSFKSNFREFLECKSYGADYIYRGQKNSNWSLISSFDRNFPDESIRNRDDRFISAVNFFIEEAIKYGYVDHDEPDDNGLAKAQHYGFPTRLLDWSYSPYVAAYFAFSDIIFNRADINHDISIWCINKSKLRSIVSDRQLSIIEVGDKNNQRVNSQMGLFTRLYTNHTSIDGFIINELRGGDDLIIKFSMPASQFREALYDLQLMGITAKLLFPGLEGIAQFSNMRRLLAE